MRATWGLGVFARGKLDLLKMRREMYGRNGDQSGLVRGKRLVKRILGSGHP